MKEIVTFILLSILSNYAFSSDTSFVKTEDGKWIKVVKCWEYKDVPNSFKKEDMEKIDQNWLVEKSVDKKTVSYFFDKKFPLLFSRQNQMMQKYSLSIVGSDIKSIDLAGEKYEGEDEIIQSEPLYALISVILVLSITLAFLLSKYDIREITGFLFLLLTGLIVGILFSSHINFEVFIAICFGTVAFYTLESDDNDFAVFFGSIAASFLAPIMSMFFYADNHQDGIIFAMSTFIFSCMIYIIRIGYESLPHRREGRMVWNKK